MSVISRLDDIRLTLLLLLLVVNDIPPDASTSTLVVGLVISGITVLMLLKHLKEVIARAKE